jgi:hypothetical protein
MKWTLAFSSPQLETFELWEGDTKLLTLEYHPFTNAARIEHAGERRVFMIRREGFLRNRTVLRDEYGMRIGQLNYEKSSPHTGTIELEDETFTYSISGEKERTLEISRAIPGAPALVCGFRQGMPEQLDGKLSPSQQCLLMAFSWYLGLQSRQESAAEMAL